MGKYSPSLLSSFRVRWTISLPTSLSQSVKPPVYFGTVSHRSSGLVVSVYSTLTPVDVHTPSSGVLSHTPGDRLFPVRRLSFNLSSLLKNRVQKCLFPLSTTAPEECLLGPIDSPRERDGRPSGSPDLHDLRSHLHLPTPTGGFSSPSVPLRHGKFGRRVRRNPVGPSLESDVVHPDPRSRGLRAPEFSRLVVRLQSRPPRLSSSLGDYRSITSSLYCSNTPRCVPSPIPAPLGRPSTRTLKTTHHFVGLDPGHRHSYPSPGLPV